MPAFRLTNVTLDEVSLVDEPATGKKFKVFKRCARCVSGSLLALIGKHRATIQKIDPSFLVDFDKQGMLEKPPGGIEHTPDEALEGKPKPGETAGNEKRDDLYMIKEPEPLEADGSFKVFVGFDSFKGAPADEDIAAFVGAEMGQEILEYDFEAPTVGEGEDASWTKGVVWTKAREEAPPEQSGGLEGQMGTAGLPGAAGGGFEPIGGGMLPAGGSQPVGGISGQVQRRARKARDAAGYPVGDKTQESVDHIAWVGDVEYWQREGNIYSASADVPVMPDGYRTGRWYGRASMATMDRLAQMAQGIEGVSKRGIPTIGLIGKAFGDRWEPSAELRQAVLDYMQTTRAYEHWNAVEDIAGRVYYKMREAGLPEPTNEEVQITLDRLVGEGLLESQSTSRGMEYGLRPEPYRSGKRMQKQYALVENDPEVMDYAMALAEELAEDGVVGDMAEVTIYEECMNEYGRGNMTTFEKFLKDLKWWAISAGLAYLIFKSDLDPIEQQFLDALRQLGGRGSLFDALEVAQRETPALVYDDALEALNGLDARGLLRIDLPDYILVAKCRARKQAGPGLSDGENTVLHALENIGGKGTVLDVQLELLTMPGQPLEEAGDVKRVLDSLVAAGYARYDERTMDYILTGGMAR